MNKVEIIEIGPRDGFQNISTYIPLEEKLRIIDGIVASGVKHMEMTSFVSPKAIPQLKDAIDLTKSVHEKYPEIDFFPLVPNLHGVRTASELGLKKVAFVVSLSESHNKANINRTHEQSFDELTKIRQTFPDIEVILDLATTFGCPFEGKDNNALVTSFLKPYIEQLGIRQVNLCDTIGIGNPAEVRRVVRDLKVAYPDVELHIHIHDTRNMGMVNTLVAIEEGVRYIQSTLGGLGGCPFAPGASGNLSTEDVVYMLNEMGYDTGIDFSQLLKVAKYETTVINGIYSGHHINIEKTSDEFQKNKR